MRLRRTESDMFGRPVPVRAERERVPLRQRSISPGLVPFLPVIVLAAVLAAIVAVPVAGISLLVVVVVATLGTIMRARYRQVKDLDYVELRRQDPLRGLGRYIDRERPPE